MALVLLGVTGGIAAYKACDLTRRFVRAGHEVVPILTAGVERFVTRETFTALAHRPPDESPYPHLTRADLLVIGTHGRTGVSKLLLGSVAERLVRFTACPVLTVRGR